MGRQPWYIEQSIKRPEGVAYIMIIGGTYNEAILAYHYARNLSHHIKEPLSYAHLEYMLKLVREDSPELGALHD